MKFPSQMPIFFKKRSTQAAYRIVCKTQIASPASFRLYPENQICGLKKPRKREIPSQHFCLKGVSKKHTQFSPDAYEVS